MNFFNRMAEPFALVGNIIVCEICTIFKDYFVELPKENEMGYGIA